jgi:hypothetical protein
MYDNRALNFSSGLNEHHDRHARMAFPIPTINEATKSAPLRTVLLSFNNDAAFRKDFCNI